MRNCFFMESRHTSGKTGGLPNGYYGISMALTGNFEEAISLCDKGLKFALGISHLPTLL